MAPPANEVGIGVDGVIMAIIRSDSDNNIPISLSQIWYQAGLHSRRPCFMQCPEDVGRL